MAAAKVRMPQVDFNQISTTALPGRFSRIRMELSLKLDESCISNSKLEISEWTGAGI
jgi:hypothetical protein